MSKVETLSPSTSADLRPYHENCKWLNEQFSKKTVQEQELDLLRLLHLQDSDEATLAGITEEQMNWLRREHDEQGAQRRDRHHGAEQTPDMTKNQRNNTALNNTRQRHNTKEARDQRGKRQRDEVRATLRVRQGCTWQANTKQPDMKALTPGRRQNQRVKSPSVKFDVLTTIATSHSHVHGYLYHVVCHAPRSTPT